MKILVTGFTGKVGHEVAQILKRMNVPVVCGVRNVDKTKAMFGDTYEYVRFDLADPSSFDAALVNVDRIFLMYPPGDNLHFETFLQQAKKKGIKHIAYSSLKDVQFMPFIHHYKNEKQIKKLGINYTFLRSGYYMQNLNDMLGKEIRERRRIFVPAGKGKTSFVDTRDIAEVAARSLQDPKTHRNKKYVITGGEALDFYEVARHLSDVLGENIAYTDPSVKEFKAFMTEQGDTAFMDIIVAVHFPTKLGLAKGMKHDFEKVTGKKPTNIRTYIEDFKKEWGV